MSVRTKVTTATHLAIVLVLTSLAFAAEAGAAVSNKMRFEEQFGLGVVSGSAAGVGNLTEGSTTVSSVTTTVKAFLEGQTIVGPGIPAGDTIIQVGTSTLTLSQAAEATSSGVSLTVAEGTGNVSTDERQTVAIEGGATGGAFTLTFTNPSPGSTTEITGGIAYNATAAQVQSALEGLKNIGAGNVAVSGPDGGPYTIEFTGSRYADTNVEQLTGSGSGLTPARVIAVYTDREGASSLERCTVFTSCMAGEPTSIAGAFRFPDAVAVAPSGNLYVDDQTNNRVEEVTSSGGFVLAFGAGVVNGGAQGTGNLLQGSTVVSSMTATKKTFAVGQAIAGAGIPANTTISAIGKGTIVLSQPASQTASAVVLTAPEGTGNVGENERQTVTIEGSPTGGSFKLTFSTPDPSFSEATTSPIKFNATAAEVESALEGLANIGPGNVSVSGPAGGPYTVEFTGERFSDTNVDQLSGDTSGLTPAGNKSLTVTTRAQGASALETCTVATQCQAGVRSEAGNPGVMWELQDIAIDPATRDVYVYEVHNFRVEEFTETGGFVLMIGRKVNETKTLEFNEPGNPNHVTEEEENLCTETEIEGGVKCQKGAPSATGSSEPGAFKVGESYDSQLALGPKEKLYVGDEGRVQVFSAAGKFECELPLNQSTTPPFPNTGRVTGLAVNGSGNIYVTEARGVIGSNSGSPPGVYEFSGCNGPLIGDIDTAASDIEAIALDLFGRMAVIEGPVDAPHGELLELPPGRALSEFSPPGGMGSDTNDLAFGPIGDLYVADPFHQDVEHYSPVPIAQLETGSCSVVTGGQMTLEGAANPENVAETEVWFQYGTTPPLELNTPKQPLSTTASVLPVTATISGLVPNQLYDYRLVGEDANDKAPEPPIPPNNGTQSCRTLAELPVIPGEPQAFTNTATFASVVLSGSINPEHARTKIRFQYANASECLKLEEERKEGNKSGPVPVDLRECPRMAETVPVESEEYALLPIQQTARELQPSTTYRYRLVGNNEFEYNGEKEGGETVGQEGTFTTEAAPAPSAVTGPASAVSTGGATIAGFVDPDGFKATYAFEVGVFEGPETQYGTLISASAGDGSSLVEERLALGGLQPGTTYAYRIVIHSGYGTVVGATMLFTTEGFPEAIHAPAIVHQVPVPPMMFPQAMTVKRPPSSAQGQRLAKALRACKRKTAKQRSKCERQARGRFKKHKHGHSTKR